MRKRNDTANNTAAENAQQGIGDNLPAETNLFAPQVASDATSDPALTSAASPAHIDSPSLIPEVSPEITALRAAAPSGAKVAAAETPLSGESESASAHADTGHAEQAKSATSRAAAAVSSRFALLAASVALAAAIGAMIGSLTTAGFNSLYAVSSVPQAAAASEETKAMTKLLTQARADIGALKASIEASNKLATTQFARITDRFERAEKSQAEPAAKITTISDTLSRVEKKLVSADVTGSIAEKPVAAVARAPQKDPQQPTIIEGWYVRDFYRGHAIVESMRGGVFEVGPGSTLPGLGRVEAVRRQDGGWVVVTPKGIIVTMR